MALLTKARPAGRLVFASEAQATVVLPAVAANLALPSVTIPVGFLPSGAQLNRVIAAIAWRKQVESSAAANAINGAQDIQVRSDAPGSFVDAIDIADNLLATASGATEGGEMIVGDEDIQAEVDEADTYEFQWTLALVDGASLTLHDFQTYLLIDFV